MSKYLTRPEAAEYLTAHGCPTSKNTLAKLATLGGGPLYRDNGKCAIYEPRHLDDYAAKRRGPLRRSTSEIVTEPETPEAA